MGISGYLEDVLQSHRVRELHVSKRFRWMIVWVNIVGMLDSFIGFTIVFNHLHPASMPQILAPLVTFTAYALRAEVTHGDPLSAAKAFTSLAIVSLMTTPTVDLLASIPALRVAEGCLDRIQKFLITDGIQARANDIPPRANESKRDLTDYEMTALNSTSHVCRKAAVVEVEQADLHPYKDSDFVLENLSLSLLPSTTTLIIGPIGSGKTALLKLIVGEIKPEKGSVSVRTESLGYCSQTPWLPNGSFRDVLCGSTIFEETWYNEVLWACDLDEVIQVLPLGDASTIGSWGSALSGGQSQRLVLLS